MTREEAEEAVQVAMTVGATRMQVMARAEGLAPPAPPPDVASSEQDHGSAQTPADNGPGRRAESPVNEAALPEEPSVAAPGFVAQEVTEQAGGT